MNAKVIPLPRITVNAPQFLKELPAWLLWRFEQVPGEKKPRKVPHYVDGGKRFGTQGTDEERRRLASYDKALAALQAGKGKWSGLGLAMLPEWGIVALDFDDCVVDGKLVPEVENLVTGTYAEYSPSGNGVRAFMAGQLQDRKSRAKPGQWGVEFFHAKGFVTITGNVLEVCELVGDEDTCAALSPAVQALYQERFKAAPVAPVQGAAWEADDPLMVSPPMGLRLSELAELVLAQDPNCDYDTWRQVGMAVHHERNGEEDGFLLWDEWSSKGTDYPGVDSLREKWATFGRYRGASVTARWLKKQFSDARHKEKIELSPNHARGMAEALMEKDFSNANGQTLQRTGGLWYRHNGACYNEMPEEAVRTRAWDFLERDCVKQIKVTNAEGKSEWKMAPFRPTTGNINAAMDALRSLTYSQELPMPSWLPGYIGPDAREIVSMANGLLHIPTRQLLPHTPGYFSQNALPYGWVENGPPREWLKFLDQVWPGDPESIDTLQEIFGYLLTADTSQQKMFMIIGPKRSGKGTIGRVLRAMLGAANVASPTLTSMQKDFGLQPLIGKLCAMLPDARVAPGSNTQAIVERLLMVSGEDCITVDRKHIEAWTGTLSSRFVFLTNETPQLGDASGALAGRFIVLSMTQSFFGREDTKLGNRLLEELPDIFRWALDGRARLNERGHFVQPKSGDEDVTEMEELSSPITAFVRDCCEVGEAFEEKVDDVYAAWTHWSDLEGRARQGTKAALGKMLRSCIAGLARNRVMVEGERDYVYSGIRLKDAIREKLHAF